ncbi:hypothetical protein D9758_001061 [Tetrapyrgos nigripes]|uniref:CCHC-type domain-containing protein n=1 Tax=Tetrapyrgos nigripes TaxID=182062 RepID=A0A8H5GSN4_9AGAR|nr:hypothetical protein D9758_001061 [Tetrapyrgos nigripes]
MDSWCIDLEPQQIQAPPSPPPPTQSSQSRLLLPAHVSVFGSVPVEILPPDVEQDYIEYLDYGGRDELPTTRYFERPEEPKQPTVLVCKHCGAKGDHVAKDCPVVICLTCGVRNEHSTLSCPISKVCFNCGMKGHINSTCPNRGRLANAYDDCDRCGSTIHTAHECPTLWRLYAYMTESERDSTLNFRRGKRMLDLGNGGEGYIAQDIWCYNCGQSGHWGDASDCDIVQHRHDIPKEYSAFSEHNTTTGPFADVTMHADQRAKQDWEQDDPMFQSWGTRVPTNVGKRGKAKEMMQLRAQQEDDDDSENFFAARMKRQDSNAKRPPSGPRRTSNAPTQPKKMSISFKSDSSTPSLLNRISDGPSSSYRDRDRDRYRDRERDKDRRRDRERDRDRDRD